MERIENKECKLISIQKMHCIFEVGRDEEIAFASPRVANDIINGSDVYIERNVRIKDKVIGNWLATPSRFN